MIRYKLIRKYFTRDTHEAVSQVVLGARRLCTSGDLYEQIEAISIRRALDIAEVVSGKGMDWMMSKDPL